VVKVADGDVFRTFASTIGSESPDMSMGKRKRRQQQPMWVAANTASELPTSPGHPFYLRDARPELVKDQREPGLFITRWERGSTETSRRSRGRHFRRVRP
jgi:hypothetical protein